MNGADVLCDTLLAHDVDVCFANPGTSEMHFVAALDERPRMRCVLGLFEGVVTGAADGYGRMADRPAATLLHLGPGLANGLASLHNARRAETPIINVVGEHASWHQRYDSPLTSDIESLARPMSHWVRRVRGAGEVSQATAEAVEASRRGAGSIATLILPADVSWDPAPGIVHRAPAAPSRTVGDDALALVARALRNGKRSALLLGGKALRSAALDAASRIAQKTGARLLAPAINARIERGQGRVKIERIPFNGDLAVKQLADVEQLILVGCEPPSLFFAYPGKPSVPTAEHCEILRYAHPSHDLRQALEALADTVEARAERPIVATRQDAPALPAPAGAAFDGSTIIQSIAALLPENAIVCDESVSAGRLMYGAFAGSAPHDYMQVTGGAIGFGIPVAAGAAVACPERKVVLMQADGSAMYTVQGLWTHAREQLDVVTVIFANRSYAVLHQELRAVGARTPGENARRMLDLDSPALDWVHIAQGAGVEAARVDNLAAFIDVFRAALKRKGPFLIEAVV